MSRKIADTLAKHNTHNRPALDLSAMLDKATLRKVSPPVERVGISMGRVIDTPPPPTVSLWIREPTECLACAVHLVGRLSAGSHSPTDGPSSSSATTPGSLLFSYVYFLQFYHKHALQISSSLPRGPSYFHPNCSTRPASVGHHQSAERPKTTAADADLHGKSSVSPGFEGQPHGRD